ncbi:hypothetical protein GOP47_0025079 [Adiantum capillus-veneris]|uniref:Alpha/beta hydrolase fold-3 domain-containing protein n=1 Tax=Adiantum capillus-veneris TaxID=13818 RepID=A0A9D4U566_ADICA|nr:hypothetical protein GOP47_0025079 [Adiantum capillus-veneris]
MGVPLVEACAEFVDGVASRDVQLRDSVWVRIFLPQAQQGAPNTPKPVVLYAHGGAYTVGQPNWLPFHAFCSTLSKLSHSIWVSLSYRLAPAHRLPPAYDDGSLALHWLRAQAEQQSSCSSDPWLSKELADFSNFFLSGDSAGANIVLKVAMDAASSNLAPLCIKGLLLIQPGFHSEAKRAMMHDKENEERYDRAVPIGETLDYAPINPLHTTAPRLTPLAAYPHIIVNASETDFRYETTIHFSEAIRGFCPHVQLFVSPGKGHAFHLDHPDCPEAHALHAELAKFMNTCTVS